MGELSPSLIAVDDTRVVWGHDRPFQQLPLRGCETVDCSSMAKDYRLIYALTGLDLRGGSIFFATSATAVVQLDPGTGSEKRFTFNMGASPQGLALGENKIYWTDKRENGMDQGVYSCFLADCPTPERLMNTGLGSLNPRTVAVSVDKVYWSTDTQVLRCPLTGCAATPEVIDGPPGTPVDVDALAADAASLYWATYQAAGAVKKCALSDCVNTIELLTSEPQGLPKTIASDGEHVYWTNLGEGTLKCCSVSGCDTPRLVADKQDEPFGVALSATHVYWANRKSGTIMRAPK